jgi:hypothetical protein
MVLQVGQDLISLEPGIPRFVVSSIKSLLEKMGILQILKGSYGGGSAEICWVEEFVGS